MSMVNGIRIVNNLLAGSLSSGQLQTLLGTATNLAAWKQVVGVPRQMAVLVQDSAAMTVVWGSALASSVFLSNTTATAALIANAAAFSSTLASSVCKMAIFNSDTALNTIAASTAAMAAMRAASQYSVITWTQNGTTPVTLTLTGTSHIVLGASQASAIVRINTFTTLRSGTSISGTQAPMSGVSNVLGEDFNCAIPIISPRAVLLNTTGTSSGYAGILRCDV